MAWCALLRFWWSAEAVSQNIDKIVASIRFSSHDFNSFPIGTFWQINKRAHTHAYIYSTYTQDIDKKANGVPHKWTQTHVHIGKHQSSTLWSPLITCKQAHLVMNKKFEKKKSFRISGNYSNEYTFPIYQFNAFISPLYLNIPI